MRRRSPKKLTVALLIALLLCGLDPFMTVTALTSIIQEWRLPYQLAVWIMTLYFLAFGVSIPVMKHLSERFGRQYIIAVSLAVCGTGALVSSIAPNYLLLFAGRLLQGVGAGGLLPPVVAVIKNYNGWKKTLLIVGSVLAPLIASFGVSAVHWRSVFFMQVPFAFFACLLLYRRPYQQRQPVAPFDVLGILLFTGIAVNLMTGLIYVEPERFWQSFLGPEVFPFVVVASGLIVPLAMVERQHRAPLVPPRNFLTQRTVYPLLTRTFAGMCWATLMFVPTFAEVLLRHQTGSGGYLAALLAVTAIVAIFLSRDLIERYGEQVVTAAGFLLIACGYLLLATVALRQWSFVLVVALLGLGLGLTLIAPIGDAFTLASREDKAKPRVLQENLFQMVGMAVGPSLVVTFLTQRVAELPARVSESLMVAPTGAGELAGGTFAELVQGIAELPIVDEVALRELIPDDIAVTTQELILRQTMNVMRNGLVEGYQDLFLAATVFALCGFTFLLAMWRLEQDERFKQ